MVLNSWSSFTPGQGTPALGIDRSGAQAQVHNGVGFSAIDSIYFANTVGGQSFNAMEQTPTGPMNIYPSGMPSYPGMPGKPWISLDYSIQLSISITQWMQWKAHEQAGRRSPRRHVKLPRRND